MINKMLILKPLEILWNILIAFITIMFALQAKQRSCFIIVKGTNSCKRIS